MQHRPEDSIPMSTYLLDLSSRRQIALALKAHQVLAIKVYEANGCEGKPTPNQTIFALQDWGQVEKGYPASMRTAEKEHLRYRDDGVTYKTRMYKIKTNQYGSVSENISILDVEYTCDGSVSRALNSTPDDDHRLHFLLSQESIRLSEYYKFNNAPTAFNVVCHSFNTDAHGEHFVNSNTMLSMPIAPYPHKRPVANIARAYDALRESAIDALVLRDPLWLTRDEFAAAHSILKQVMTS